MADRAGHDPHVQPRPRFGDEPDQPFEPAERLLQQVVRVGQPQHLVPLGQRVAAEEVAGGERLSAAGAGGRWRTPDPATRTTTGAFDPTQSNVPGYFSLKPGDKSLDLIDSPRNNNWYLLTRGARRGLTFLEEQPEVDAIRRQSRGIGHT